MLLIRIFNKIKKFLGKNIVIVINEDSLALELTHFLPIIFPEINSFYFPHWNIPPYSGVSPSKNILYTRLSAMLSMRSTKPFIMVTSAIALQQKICSNAFYIKVNNGDKISIKHLTETLIAYGYERATTAFVPGIFALRGGVLDIISQNGGVRINFSEDKVESIKTLDPNSQLSIKKIDEAIILPISEVVLDEDSIGNFKANYINKFQFQTESIYSSVLSRDFFPGIEHMLPFFCKKMSGIYEIIDNPIFILENDFENHLNSNFSNILEKFEDALKYEDNPYKNISISSLYIDPNELLTRLAHSKTAISEDTASTIPDIMLPAADGADFRKCIEEIDSKFKIFITCDTSEKLKKIKNIITHAEDIKRHIEVVLHTENRYNFFYEDKCFISYKYLFSFGNEERKRSGAKKQAQQISLKEGEMVVHKQYGVGKFLGLRVIDLNGIVRDYIEILYKDNDKLYVPVENAELIFAYGNESHEDLHVSIDKLGGNQWNEKKSKIRKRIQIAAKQLIDAAAIRKQSRAHNLEISNSRYELFCSRFPFLETDDQAITISEVLSDISKDSPMDRMVCADVGFGKTEVALRAACAATLGDDKVQVAIIVPTTLLSRQHYKTFKERFSDFPVEIGQLSKFTTTAEKKRIKNDLSTGSLDIVIGTHALLADNISFKNLGLIIIDEEQRFGVIQKEKIQNFKKNAHILTLSATPIPRTLQMGLLGIKSMSVINTPPISRKPVNTFIVSGSSFAIRDAILMEKSRGGRVFYVVPRTSQLYSVESKLSRILPELRVRVAHGAMKASDLDNIMNDFYDDKFDILLSTNIIESGLDIPFANTIIVDNAQMFGLTQLHQLRGRVGRGAFSGYAYFILPNINKISKEAKERMASLKRFSDVGDGFGIAMDDLSHRGYGNLLGAEQSGNVQDIGEEFYREMLQDAIESLNQQNMKDAEEVDKDWSPIINIGTKIHIPESYIGNDELRLSVYREVALIKNEAQANMLLESLQDRFGTIPEEIHTLFSVVKIKQLAKNIGVNKLEVGDCAILISLHTSFALKINDIINFINYNINFKLKPCGKLVFKYKNQTKIEAAISALKLMKEWFGLDKNYQHLLM